MDANNDVDNDAFFLVFPKVTAVDKKIFIHFKRDLNTLSFRTKKVDWFLHKILIQFL